MKHERGMRPCGVSGVKFTSYAPGGFGPADQQRLAKAAQAAANRGARVVISNHNVPVARGLFAGAEIHKIQVHRSISCKASTRGKVGEIIAVYHPRVAAEFVRAYDSGFAVMDLVSPVLEED